ncbi:metallopeptidase family protein [Georgenia sp. 10Sc9-8]|uniref:Metallopeptidase family protein n=1 Tax=Georgenia halotolerans TaxID=3028317 RepID=A0ABT5TXZ0_9MICO|nr:metallopeptidase family protein [Georgenia halotolerans]
MVSEPLPAVPARRRGRRRDRRGRGLRGPLVPPTLPAWRTRAERFDEMVVRVAEHLEHRFARELHEVEFAVEEVPPSEPSPWERDAVALGRYFPADGAAGLRGRIVVYRRPIVARCETPGELAEMVREVVVEQVAGMLGRDPRDVDPE